MRTKTLSVCVFPHVQMMIHLILDISMWRLNTDLMSLMDRQSGLLLHPFVTFKYSNV